MTELLTIDGGPEAGAAPFSAPHFPAEPLAPAAVGPANPADNAPSHCGTAMEWTEPALVAASAYSFDAGTAQLPPVWRCSCGFQLDGVIHTPHALAALS